MMKFLNIFKWRVKIVQKAYDLGYAHGIEAGKVERHNEILSLLTHNIESIDWVREEPIQVRDIIPMVKNHKEVVEADVWSEK